MKEWARSVAHLVGDLQMLAAVGLLDGLVQQLLLDEREL